jgi:hypothetical protein
LPVQLGSVIERALEKQRDARHASVAELMRELAVFTLDADSGSQARVRARPGPARRWLQHALLGLACGSLAADSPLQAFGVPVHAQEPVRRALAQTGTPATIDQLPRVADEAPRGEPASLGLGSMALRSNAPRPRAAAVTVKLKRRRTPPMAASDNAPERASVQPRPRHTITLDEL